MATDPLFRFNRYSILLIIEVTGVFCLFKTSEHLKNPNKYFKIFITAVASCSYGMYLTHCMFIHFFGKLAQNSTIPMPTVYVILLLAAFFGSLGLIYILGRIPYVQDFVGVK